MQPCRHTGHAPRRGALLPIATGENGRKGGQTGGERNSGSPRRPRTGRAMPARARARAARIDGRPPPLTASSCAHGPRRTPAPRPCASRGAKPAPALSGASSPRRAAAAAAAAGWARGARSPPPPPVKAAASSARSSSSSAAPQAPARGRHSKGSGGCAAPAQAGAGAGRSHGSTVESGGGGGGGGRSAAVDRPLVAVYILHSRGAYKSLAALSNAIS